MEEFTHFDETGNAIMVDVSDKMETVREAIARGEIHMNQKCFELVKKGGMKKGDVLGVARIAGIMGAKKTYDLIPLCHMIALTKAEISFSFQEDRNSVEAVCRVRTVGKTGVEMEALTGAATAMLTIYDMCKAIDKTMEISEIRLCRKSGGRSGIFLNPLEAEVQ